MIYKLNQRQEAQRKNDEELAQGGAHDHLQHGEESEEDENLLTIDESMKGSEEGEGEEKENMDEMFLVNQSKTQSIIRCMRMLRFIQLLCEGHHTEMQNFLRE